MKVIMGVNDELSVLAGMVTRITEDRERVFSVELEYEEGTISNKSLMHTEVVFQDHEATKENANPKLYAQWARKKRLRMGSTIAVLVRFVDESHQTANGYSCKYSGILTFPPHKEDEKERNVVTGTVSWIRETKNKLGEPILSLGIYLGKTYDGALLSTILYVKDVALISRCKTELTPGDDGKKCKASFRCGEKQLSLSNEGVEQTSYRAFDFTRMD